MTMPLWWEPRETATTDRVVPEDVPAVADLPDVADVAAMGAGDVAGDGEAQPRAT